MGIKTHSASYWEVMTLGRKGTLSEDLHLYHYPW